MTTIAELRELGVEDLRQRAHDLEDQLFRLRLQKSMGQLEAPTKLQTLRRELARVHTLITEKSVVRR
jgi:large subunit ribosomal protein L29